jgi:hypothetical protein
MIDIPLILVAIAPVRGQVFAIRLSLRAVGPELFVVLREFHFVAVNVALIGVAIHAVFVQVAAVVVDIALILVAICAVLIQVPAVMIDVSLILIAVRAIVSEVPLVLPYIFLVALHVLLLQSGILALRVSTPRKQGGKGQSKRITGHEMVRLHFSLS